MDSFNTAILPNPWRLRENPVSTLMACMGMAECLHAPKAILAGTDLCYMTPSNCYYENQGNAVNHHLAPPFLVTEKDQLFLPNRQGKGVYSLLRYVATAAEAGKFAQLIQNTTGTQFYTLNDDGILSPELFQCFTIQNILQLPQIDRLLLENKADRALAEKEEIKLVRLKVDCSKTIDSLDQIILHLKACQLQKDMCNEARENVIRQFADKERDYSLPNDDKLRLRFAIRLARQWRRECIQARNVALAHMLTSRKAAIPLLCLPQEADSLPGGLDRLFPKFCWQITPIASIATPSQWRRPGELFPSQRIHAFLHEADVAFVTPAARESYSYHFEVLGTDNVVFLDHTLMG